MRVEYLVLIDSAEEFCRSVHSFNNLIQAYENIKIQGDDIFYHGKSFRYEVIYEDIGREHQRYFHIKLTCHNNQSIEQFRELLKSLRTILTKVSGRPPETVWDEISTDLCIKAYPLIHHTENLLRKLITKFMLANIGVGWQKEAIPQEVVDSIKSKSSDRSQNYLYELDFIQLSNLLFKEYSTGDSRKFIEAIAIASEITELNLKELKEIVPRSNWERYFAPIVNCDSNYLKKRWEKLYEFRCKVAHNRFLTPSELTEVQTFTADVNEKFQEALDNLDKVQVTEDQKEEVAINIAATTNNNFAAFLSRWEKLNRTLRNLDNLIAQDDEIEKLNGSKIGETLLILE
ncbi:HEPN domain-containing protein [Chromobacterium haemolyticum]|uniref:HEPN domain-containing protein n=1 Tax=Chromobacterium haemolyticum TaxID=394935 RepID=UPI002952AEA6|nr:HEPN domain-containing protein [Chromobacterium haemolyticum]WON82720.1 HEPN domain-containing protein [Chromobacterium haemolyticum]